ncbi:MAG: hypothetical protein CL868_05035 [Cytophagaceae bacterium]|nr:hypothetical protein [Cytophagaceae bacterium]|tara:strand:+ start:490 stop:1407 length:918 start_codon:yes stop_codon:yes gene_type:complete
MNNEKQIHKWLNGEMTADELAAFKQSQDYRDYADIAHFTADMKAPTLDVEESLKEFKYRYAIQKEPKVIKHNFAWISGVAAAVLVLLVSVWFFINSADTNITTSIAESTQAILPDNSTVVLNADTELSYNTESWQKNRKVILKGEAFFKVAKGSKFTVNTAPGEVTVLGTQFNVKSRGNYFEVQCFEGRVAVAFNDKEYILTPGKRFRYINDQVTVDEDLKGKFPLWTIDESNFDNIPLKEVVQELERQYDIKFEADGVDMNQEFTGSFTHKNLDLALKSVMRPLAIDFTIDGKTVILTSRDEAP